jgi:SnoaL-like domain
VIVSIEFLSSHGVGNRTSNRPVPLIDARARARDNSGMTVQAVEKPLRHAAIASWLERFRLAWEHGDAGDWIEWAFTEDAVFRHHPMRPPHCGHDEIRLHLRRQAAILGDAELRFGRPVIDGTRAVVEWWANTTDGTHHVTMTGSVFVRFADDGRVEELRRYGDMHPGAHDVPHGWEIL